MYNTVKPGRPNRDDGTEEQRDRFCDEGCVERFHTTSLGKIGESFELNALL